MHTRTRPAVSAAILAGGAATRMGGAMKALLDVDGAPVLLRQLSCLHGRFAEILCVVRDQTQGEEIARLGKAAASLRLVTDLQPARSSLTGIHAALAHAASDHVFVVAGDAPLLRPELVDALLTMLDDADDVLLPRKPDGYLEPLCAIYSRRCLPHIEALLASGNCKIVNFFSQVRVSELPVNELLAADPLLHSFQNANTPEQLAAVRDLAAQLRLAREAS